MKRLTLKNGLVVDVGAIARAGNIPIDMAELFLLQLPADTGMRKITFLEELDRATTHTAVEDILKRITHFEPRNYPIFERAIKRMLDIAMSDLDRATSPEEICTIRTRTIPGGNLDALEREAMRRLAEFFVV